MSKDSLELKIEELREMEIGGAGYGNLIDCYIETYKIMYGETQFLKDFVEQRNLQYK